MEGAGTLSAVIGMNVFYFISAPIMRALRGADPFSPRARRAHIASSLDFIAASLFTHKGTVIEQFIDKHSRLRIEYFPSGRAATESRRRRLVIGQA